MAFFYLDESKHTENAIAACRTAPITGGLWDMQTILDIFMIIPILLMLINN